MQETAWNKFISIVSSTVFHPTHNMGTVGTCTVRTEYVWNVPRWKKITKKKQLKRRKKKEDIYVKKEEEKSLAQVQYLNQQEAKKEKESRRRRRRRKVSCKGFAAARTKRDNCDCEISPRESKKYIRRKAQENEEYKLQQKLDVLLQQFTRRNRPPPTIWLYYPTAAVKSTFWCC